MRISAPTAVAAGLLALSVSAAPARAATPTPPTPIAVAASTATLCPVDAKAINSAGVVAEVEVSRPAQKAANGTLAVAVRTVKVLKGPQAGPVSLMVTGGGCAARVVQRAQSKDRLIVLGTLQGTQLLVNGASATVLVRDQACQVEKALGTKICETASTGVVFSDLVAPKPQPWLKIAAPGLAAIIVSVLGLLLLRLRRR